MEKETLAVIILFLTGIMVGAFAGAEHQRRQYRAQAIKHHAAQYNHETGRFEWLEPVEKEVTP